jgi:hypothetical protein
MAAEDLGIVIAGNHFAATQTMDEGSSQTVNYDGAFGTNKAIIRTVTPADEDTISFTALLLKPGQNAGMEDESWMRDLKNFQIAARRGANKYFVYDDCVWTSLRVASTRQSVTLTGDFSGHIAA